MSTIGTENKINCEVIGDLIPLYVDNALSQSSAALVEEHIAECGNCSEKVKLLTGEIKPVFSEDKIINEDIASLKRIKKGITRRKAIACAVTAAVIFMIFGIYMLVNYLNDVQIEYTYSDLEKKIQVVSTSDIASTSDKKSVSVIYHSDDKHIKSCVYHKKLGESGGKIQVEAYVYAYHQPLDDINIFYSPFSFIDSIKGYLLLCDSPDASYKSGNMYVTEGLSGTYDFSDFNLEDIEIVRIYYSKWGYDNYKNGDPYIKIYDRSHLLWAKSGYEK